MIATRIRSKSLRCLTLTNIRHIKQKRPSKDVKKAGDSQEQIDYKYVPYMKTFNMLTNATTYEAKHTDIDEIHPSTQANKVSKKDWVKDLEHRKQEQERLSKEQSSKPKNTKKDPYSDAWLPNREDRLAKDNNHDIRRNNYKKKPKPDLKPRSDDDFNSDKKVKRIYGNA